MKIIFSLFVSCLLFTCCGQQANFTYKSIAVEKTMPEELGQRIFNCDSTVNVRDLQIDSLKLVLIDNRRMIDSLSAQLFLSNFKVEKVKYYIKICQSKPSNNKFFKGWVIRAVK